MKKKITSFVLTAAILLSAVTMSIAQAKPQSVAPTKIYIDKKGDIHDHGGTLPGYFDKKQHRQGL